MITGATIAMMTLPMFTYILGRFDSRAECEKIRKRSDKYKAWYKNTHTRLERIQFENDMLRAQLEETNSQSLRRTTKRKDEK